MRNLISLILISQLILACSNGKEQPTDELLKNGSRQELQAKKDALQQSVDSIKNQLNKISARLEALNPNNNVVLVETKIAKTDTFKTYFNVQGNVTTDENIILNPEFSGVIKEIYVEEGDKVSEGDLIARIDDGGLQERLDELKTRLNLAKTTYERRKRLWDENIGSEIEFLQAESNFKSLQQNVVQVKKELNKTRVRAPFDGEIDDIIADVGQMAMPGNQPIVRITSLDDLYIEADIPENYLGSIKKGTAVSVESKSANMSFKSEIARVAQTIQPDNRSFRIRVNTPDALKSLKPNMVVKLTINNYQNKNAFVISESILQENTDGKSYIFKVNKEDNKELITDIALVKLGQSYNGQIEIIEGIGKGDQIITEGAKGLRKGQQVKVKN